MTLLALDLSHYQSGIQLTRTDGQAFVFKATEGSTYTDPACTNFVAQARAAHHPWGLYHFWQGNAGEADRFLARARQLDAIGEAVLVLDFETHTSDNAGAKKWLDRVRSQTGVTPWIYMSQSIANSDRWAEVARTYPLWVARYNTTLGPVGPWETPLMWQYTDAHPTAGYRVDANHFYGTTTDWHHHASIHEEDDMPLNDNDKRFITTAINNAVDAAFKRRVDPKGNKANPTGEDIRQFDLNAQLNPNDTSTTDTVRNRLRGTWNPDDDSEGD